MFKKIIALLSIIAICITIVGCGNDEETVELSTPQERIDQSVLVRPATNEDFRYNIYTHYVEISECLSTKSNIVIPDTIQDLPVYKICENAFTNQRTFTSLTMTNNIIEIGMNAFQNCSQLTSVTLSNNLEILGDGAFAECENIKSITIPATLTTIPSGAFAGCTRLRVVNIESNAKIGDEAPTSRTITSGAFDRCENLKAVAIPEDFTELEDGCFVIKIDEDGHPVNNFTVYGVDESAAANFAAVNRLDFQSKSEFGKLSDNILSTNKVEINQTVASTNLKLSLTSVFVMNESFDYVTNKKTITEQLNDNEKIVFAGFNATNSGGTAINVNLLDFNVVVDGYIRKVSSYDYVPQITNFNLGFNGSPLNGELKEAGSTILGCVAIKVPADWETIDIIYKGDVTLESSAFEIKSTDTYIKSIGIGGNATPSDDVLEIDINNNTTEEITNNNYNEKIPENATYITVSGEKYEAGQDFPSVLHPGDVYVYGDYEYHFMREYNVSYESAIVDGKVRLKDSSVWSDKNFTSKGWAVRVKDASRTGYGKIEESINGHPVINMNGTFFNCTKLVESPEIPKTVESLNETYGYCISLKRCPKLPDSIKSIKGTFNTCVSLSGDITFGKNIDINTVSNTFNMCASKTENTIKIFGNASGDVKNAIKSTGTNKGEFIIVN